MVMKGNGLYIQTILPLAKGKEMFNLLLDDKRLPIYIRDFSILRYNRVEWQVLEVLKRHPDVDLSKCLDYINCERVFDVIQEMGWRQKGVNGNLFTPVDARNLIRIQKEDTEDSSERAEKRLKK